MIDDFLTPCDVEICNECGEYEHDCQCTEQSSDKPWSYTIISSEYDDTVSSRVTNHLEQGWELYGELRVIPRPKARQVTTIGNEFMFVQVMVRREQLHV